MTTTTSPTKQQKPLQTVPEKQPEQSTTETSSQQERSNLFERIKNQMPRTRSRSRNPPTVDTKCDNMTDSSQPKMERKTSSPTSPTTTQPKPPVKRNSTGTFSGDCGRHSTDWLFNGFSVRGTAKGLLKRRDS